MMKLLAIIPLTLRAMRRRLLLLTAFAVVLLAFAGSGRLLSGGGDHVDLDPIFQLGGATLASAFLLSGWLVGRLPLIVTLVLLGGLFSQDRHDGTARLYFARPVSPLAVYGMRFLALSVLAFLFCSAVMPLFDLILLSQWAGPATFVLVAANVIAYGSVVALLSVWTRADAWITLMLAVLAIAWHGLRSAGLLEAVPIGGRDFVTLMLPPHGALLALENAFGQLNPIPWDAVLNVCVYGATMLVITAFTFGRREV
jgi:ABC-type transport system involved in multi-copper enzyme maturation permease subunit